MDLCVLQGSFQLSACRDGRTQPGPRAARTFPEEKAAQHVGKHAALHALQGGSGEHGQRGAWLRWRKERWRFYLCFSCGFKSRRGPKVCWEQQSPHTQVNQPLNLGPRQCVMSSGWPVPSSAILKTSSCLCKMAPTEQPNLRAEPPIQYPEFTAAKNSSVPALVGTQD